MFCSRHINATFPSFKERAKFIRIPAVVLAKRTSFFIHYYMVSNLFWPANADVFPAVVSVVPFRGRETTAVNKYSFAGLIIFANTDIFYVGDAHICPGLKFHDNL